MLSAFAVCDDDQVAVSGRVVMRQGHTAVAGSEDVVVFHTVEVDAVVPLVAELLIEIRIPVRIGAETLRDLILPADYRVLKPDHCSLFSARSCSCSRTTFSFSGTGRPRCAAFSIREMPSLDR